METYITICEIDGQFPLCCMGICCVGQETQARLCINLGGVWDGEGGGREVQKGEDGCILMADSC